MKPEQTLAASRALWNRTGFDPASEEALAQVLDRGSMADWRALHALARVDQSLRRRIVHVVARAPMYLPHFWLAAMESLGEVVDQARVAPSDGMQE